MQNISQLTSFALQYSFTGGGGKNTLARNKEKCMLTFEIENILHIESHKIHHPSQKPSKVITEFLPSPH
jgi:hypothetical protein